MQSLFGCLLLQINLCCKEKIQSKFPLGDHESRVEVEPLFLSMENSYRGIYFSGAHNSKFWGFVSDDYMLLQQTHIIN